MILNKKKLFIFLKYVLVSLLFTSLPSHASETFPINGMVLRLVPTIKERPDGLGIKTISVMQKDDEIVLKWNSEIKKSTGHDPWPSFRVTTNSGQIKTTDWKRSNFLLHPNLWPEGSFSVGQTSLLWFPLNWTQNVKETIFEPGFLNATPLQLKTAPGSMAEAIGQFQQLAALLPQANTLQDKPDEKTLKTIENFISLFTHVHVLNDKAAIPIAINNEKRKIDVIVVGNQFVEYGVMNDPNNPLVVSLAFKSANAPAEFKSLLSFFQENLGFKITQIRVEQ